MDFAMRIRFVRTSAKRGAYQKTAWHIRCACRRALPPVAYAKTHANAKKLFTWTADVQVVWP